MDQKHLKNLVKKELLHSVWEEINNLHEKHASLNRTKLGTKITGNHSWYSAALFNGEDIYLSSFVRILSQLIKENDLGEEINIGELFTEDIVNKAVLLNHLSSNKEKNSYLPEFIQKNEKLFRAIRLSLAPLAGEYKLGSYENQQTYDELTNILKNLEDENHD